MPSLGVLILMAVLMFGVAFIYSNLGLGGGLLYVPILLSLATSSEDIAVPISLTLTVATALPATINHYPEGFVDVSLGVQLLGGALLGAILGALFNLGTDKVIFLAFFIGLILLMGSKLLYDWLRQEGDEDEDIESKWTSGRKAASSGATVASGFVSGGLGVGGGIINVPLMVYVLGRKTRKAIGTSSFMIITTAIVGFASYLYFGGTSNVDFNLILVLWPLVFVGAYTGSRWGLAKLKTRSVQFVFILVLFIAAAKLSLDLWNSVGA